MSECKMDGCTGKVRSRGMCNAHYLRWARKNLPGIKHGNGKPRTPCKLDGCDEPFKARGLCHRHYNEWRLRNETPEQRKKRLKKMRDDYLASAQKHSHEDGITIATRLLQLGWDRIGKLAAARRYVGQR